MEDQNTCVFCGWTGQARVCPICEDYKGIVTAPEREFDNESDIERDREVENAVSRQPATRQS